MSNPITVFNEFPILDAGDYILRQVTYDDTEAYFEYISDKEVQRFVPNECIPKTLEETKGEIDYLLDLFRYRRSIYWGVARKSDNKLIGSCGYNYWNRDHARAEISYDLARPFWRQGITTQAVKAVMGFGFSRMELHRIEATVTPINTPSLGLLRKLKFKKEGILREQKLLHGKYHDAIMLSMLQREYLGF